MLLETIKGAESPVMADGGSSGFHINGGSPIAGSKWMVYFRENSESCFGSFRNSDCDSSVPNSKIVPHGFREIVKSHWKETKAKDWARSQRSAAMAQTPEVGVKGQIVHVRRRDNWPPVQSGKGKLWTMLQ